MTRASSSLLDPAASLAGVKVVVHAASGRSTLTPAQSATPSQQRRTSHNNRHSVDAQSRSQIRSINAAAESFFAWLKGELIDLQAWPTRAMARRAIVEYIAWYNGTRLHSTLGYKTPAEFEEQDKIRR